MYCSYFFFFFFAQADQLLQSEKRLFHQSALDYVVKLQEVNEKKKFEFVETVSINRNVTVVRALILGMGVAHFLGFGRKKFLVSRDQKEKKVCG